VKKVAHQTQKPKALRSTRGGSAKISISSLHLDTRGNKACGEVDKNRGERENSLRLQIEVSEYSDG